MGVRPTGIPFEKDKKVKASAFGEGEVSFPGLASKDLAHDVFKRHNIYALFAWVVKIVTDFWNRRCRPRDISFMVIIWSCCSFR